MLIFVVTFAKDKPTIYVNLHMGGRGFCLGAGKALAHGNERTPVEFSSKAWPLQWFSSDHRQSGRCCET
jgi:hypothetical protein